MSQQVGKDPVEPYDVLALLVEIADLRAENKRLRRRVTQLEDGRALWRERATRYWKQGAWWQQSTSA